MSHIKIGQSVVFSTLLGLSTLAQAAPAMMSADWAAKACDAWNADPVLTDELAASGWAGNDGGRGHKVLQIYRSDCEGSPKVEVHIALEDGKAHCTYGGAVKTNDFDNGRDYVMNAETSRWVEMGAGEYGPMKAMMFGRLKFDGPMWEAMNNMGPFEAFLRIPGKIEGDITACP